MSGKHAQFPSIHLFCIYIFSRLIQSNLIHSKSSGLEVLFRIISSSNYREEDIKYITLKNDYHYYFSIKHKFWAHKRNISRRYFFYAPKTYVIIDIK